MSDHITLKVADGIGTITFNRPEARNAFDREPHESYVSPPYELRGRAPTRLEWDARIPPTTKLRFQLRLGDSRDGLDTAEWRGPVGANSFYDVSGSEISGVPQNARWIQYRAIFVSPNGSQSPSLHQVRVKMQA